MHGDIFRDNVLFQKNKIKAIIDFEEACNYIMAYDVGVAVIGLCMEDPKIDSKKVQALLAGYQKIRPLKKRGKANLKLFMEYAAVLTSNWRIWKYHIDSPNPKRKNKHREMMAIAGMVRGMPKKKFKDVVFGGTTF